MDELLEHLASFGLGGVVIGGLVFVAFKNPDIAKKWASILFELLSLVFKKLKYKSTKYAIESRVNSFADRLSKSSGSELTKVRIVWAARDDNEECQLEEDKVVLVMRDRGYKNKNFVHAAYFYASNILLWRIKKHISNKQGKAIDIFTTKKIIEEEDTSALRVFMEEYFQPLMEDEKVKEMVGYFIEIDSSGFYMNILLKELSYLGSKTFFGTKDSELVEEVRNIIEFLYNFSQREVGDNTTRDSFVGKYSRCSIKIVSTLPVRESGNIESPTKRIIDAFRLGIENIYVIGPYDDGKNFIDKACEKVCEDMKDCEIVCKKGYTGRTIKNGKKKVAKTYFIHLQNPKSIQYEVNRQMVDDIGNNMGDDNVD